MVVSHEAKRSGVDGVARDQRQRHGTPPGLAARLRALLPTHRQRHRQRQRDEPVCVLVVSHEAKRSGVDGVARDQRQRHGTPPGLAARLRALLPTHRQRHDRHGPGEERRRREPVCVLVVSHEAKRSGVEGVARDQRQRHGTPPGLAARLRALLPTHKQRHDRHGPGEERRRREPVCVLVVSHEAKRSGVEGVARDQRQRHGIATKTQTHILSLRGRCARKGIVESRSQRYPLLRNRD